MSKVFIEDTELTAIADAIRSKNGTSDTYKPSEMGEAILGIPEGFPNGTEWSPSNFFPSSGTEISYIYYANRLWFASGQYTYFDETTQADVSEIGTWYSTDNGKTWNLCFDIIFDYIINANGVWIGHSSDDGSIYYSSDGITWKQSNIVNCYGIANHNGIWVCSGESDDGQGIYYSTDGANWILTDITYAADYAIYADNGIWLASSQGAGGGTWYSTDGKVWDSCTTTDESELCIYLAIYANGIWVASGGYGIYYSTDGANWTLCTDSIIPTYIKNANGIWVADGLYYSYDGKTWNQTDITDVGTCTCLTYANGIWVAGVHGSESYDIAYSENGINWTKCNVNESSSFSYIEYANGNWVANATERLYYSYDRKTWVQSNVDDASIEVITYDNGIWFAHDIALGCLYSSVTWEPS